MVQITGFISSIVSYLVISYFFYTQTPKELFTGEILSEEKAERIGLIGLSDEGNEELDDKSRCPRIICGIGTRLSIISCGSKTSYDF